MVDSTPTQFSVGLEFNYCDTAFIGIIQGGDFTIIRARAIDVKVGLFLKNLLDEGLGSDMGLPDWLSSLQDTCVSLECAIGIPPDRSVSFSVFDVEPSAEVTVLGTVYQFRGISVALAKTDGVLCKIELSVSIGGADYLFYFKYESKNDAAAVWSFGGMTSATSSGKLVVFNPENPDGFLKLIVPPGGVAVDFDFDAGDFPTSHLYSDAPPAPEEHLKPATPAGLGFEIPVNAKLFDALTVDSVYLGVGMPKEPFKIPVTIAVTAGVQLGPFAATVKRMGVTTDISFPSDRKGNLGPLQLDFGIKLPDGAGMSLETDFISGGGYLSFDEQKGEYAGILSLSIREQITVTAIGILTTKLPNGEPGFSLLLIISGEFVPIQLGYGFTLNGVGGLLGLNRTMSLEGLQNGVRAGSIDSVMFPDDPIREAPRIINDLNTFFPVAEGRSVFGPMGIIAWGTPEIIRAEIGLIIELPLPIRIALLGRVSIILPSRTLPKELQLIVLQADIIGAIDFEKGIISLDASLTDSKIGTFPISGDAAMRLKWLGEPNFAISVGGFHPSARPPEGFPILKRVAITLIKGNNPRLRLEAYIAIMTNSVQFGARLDFFYKVNKDIKVLANLSFDTLIQFSPFRIEASMVANAVIKAYVIELCVMLSLKLVGPKPWIVNGTAAFKVAWVKYEVNVEKRIGRVPDNKNKQESTFNLTAEMEKALGSRSNWHSDLSSIKANSFMLRKDTGDEDQDGAEDRPILVHPLASVTFNQKIAPLNLKLDKVGNAKITGENEYKIDAGQFKVFGTDVDLTNEEEYFPPAQYYNMSNAKKLAEPSFKKYVSGISFSGIKQYPVGEASDVEYNDIIIDAHQAEDFSHKVSEIQKINHFASRNALVLTQRKRRGFVRNAGSKIDVKVKHDVIDFRG